MSLLVSGETAQPARAIASLLERSRSSQALRRRLDHTNRRRWTSPLPRKDAPAWERPTLVQWRHLDHAPASFGAIPTPRKQHSRSRAMACHLAAGWGDLHQPSRTKPESRRLLVFLTCDSTAETVAFRSLSSGWFVVAQCGCQQSGRSESPLAAMELWAPCAN